MIELEFSWKEVKRRVLDALYRYHISKFDKNWKKAVDYKERWEFMNDLFTLPVVYVRDDYTLKLLSNVMDRLRRHYYYKRGNYHYHKYKRHEFLSYYFAQGSVRIWNVIENGKGVNYRDHLWYRFRFYPKSVKKGELPIVKIIAKELGEEWRLNE